MNILTSVCVFVIIMALRQVSSYTQTCIKEYCFTTPDASQLTDFNGAKSWCANNGSTLAVINNIDVQQALTEFLQSSDTNSTTFINVKLYQHDYTWFQVDGSRYIGYVGNQNPGNYRLYCCLKPNGNRFQVDASQPSEIYRYICVFQDTVCLNNSTKLDAILYNSRCFVKYENETLTWYQARERCVDNGGDLATFQAESNSYYPPFDTSWLNTPFAYWVAIRWNDWRWLTPDGGTSNEAIYTSWSIGEPNNYENECVCVDPKGNPAWSWTDCNCSQTRQFVCLRIVPTTTVRAFTTTPATNATKISTTSEVIEIIPNSATNALAIGLGAGLGGGLFIVILVVLIVVVVVGLRKRRRKNSGAETRHKDENQHTATTPNTEIEASEFYAHIVPTNQHPAENKSQNDVIYAKPEFPNSTPSGSDPNTIRQGRVKSIMLEGPSDFYANSASVS